MTKRIAHSPEDMFWQLYVPKGVVTCIYDAIQDDEDSHLIETRLWCDLWLLVSLHQTQVNLLKYC